MIIELEAQEIVYVPASSAEEKKASVIFLHGLGHSNLTWKEVVTEALAPRLPNVQWILPQAPHRPVSLNQGTLRPSWFDITNLPPQKDEWDETTIAESIARIENIVLREVHSGVESSRIVLVGFSQGAALSLMTALSTLHELGGVVSLSGWIPHAARSSGMLIHVGDTKMPILWCHGTSDTEIPLSMGIDAVEYLKSDAVQLSEVDMKTYDGLEHRICDEELADLAEWLEGILK
ncbi:lysophospholipase i [Moniliophthora roreri MCA 2997]|uniref:Acyl-protein thioesterase 1 n=2 Tax=Moniliophthora roreri TaxID=221103 RepID=V2WHC4_MONRO|nr:lysophospholipase i [Moniliophthora roreri MCA 2997]KAI3615482.1 lysophospholipase i [Moniliophthora roreri]